MTENPFDFNIAEATGKYTLSNPTVEKQIAVSGDDFMESDTIKGVKIV